MFHVLETFTGQVKLMMSSTRATLPSRHVQALQEHGALIEHFRFADAAAAEALMKRHIRESASALYTHLMNPGEQDR